MKHFWGVYISGKLTAYLPSLYIPKNNVISPRGQGFAVGTKGQAQHLIGRAGKGSATRLLRADIPQVDLTLCAIMGSACLSASTRGQGFAVGTKGQTPHFIDRAGKGSAARLSGSDIPQVNLTLCAARILFIAAASRR